MTDDKDPSDRGLGQNLPEIFLKHYKEADKVGVFDPLLSVVSPPSRHGRMSGGYKLWPEAGSDPANTLRLLSYGNSTGVWPLGNWSELVARKLEAKLLPVTLFHGAGKGNTSSQEAIRILRDAPAIRPHLAFSLSGICDIGYLLNSATQPFAHKYTRRVLDFVRETTFVSDVVYGYPDTSSPAAAWCRNQRLARVLAEELGFPLIVFLQPVQGYGTYDQSDEEKAFYTGKAKVILGAAGKPYGDCVKEFYDEVLTTIAHNASDYDHIVDFTNVFADCPGAYRDHRHQNDKGVAHLAARMLPHIEAGLVRAGLLPREVLSRRLQQDAAARNTINSS